MNKCSVPGCKKEADGEMMFKGREVCSKHENYHFKSDGTYIWKKLNLLKEMRQKESQLKLG